MSYLNPQKLHTTFLEGADPNGPQSPRAYTLTHSDSTGDLFLTIGPDHNRPQISGWYTRLIRDEVLAEWQHDRSSGLHIHCHVSGGLVLGAASWRDAIFRKHMPMVIEALYQGDQLLIEANPSLEAAPVTVHFHSTKAGYDRQEAWGQVSDYVPPASLESVHSIRGSSQGEWITRQVVR